MQTELFREVDCHLWQFNDIIKPYSYITGGKKMKSGTRRILSGVVAIAIAATLTVPAMAADTTSFDDIGQHWAKDSIMLCLQHGAVDGTKDADENGVSSFKPNDNVTLGQFLAVITRLVAPEKIVEMPNQAHWAVPNYNAAVQSGIIKSSDFSNTKEALNTNLSRQDMAYILVGAAKVHGETLEILPNVESLMGDYSSIPNTRQDAVKRAYSNGLLAGDTNGNFKPADPMTRGQMATVVCRLMEYTPRDTVSVDTNQVQAGDTIMGGYVSNVGETKGMLLSKYSRQYELQALDGVRYGEDGTGVYVEYTAPQLPDEIKNSFTFTFNATVTKSNGDYFATQASADNVKPGETVKVYFYSYASEGTKGITKNQIDIATAAVMIQNADGKEMFIRKVNTTDKTHAVGVWYDGETETVDYNSSAIFAGIGK